MRWLAIANGVLAIGCGLWLLVPLPTIGGLHPAIKPLKFAASVALLAATLAYLLPAIAIGDRLRAAITWVLVVTLGVEMIAIVAQAARGRASHFNEGTAGDALVWSVMGGAIVVATGALLVTAWLASARAIALPPLVATGFRIGLWLLLLTAISGFAMGGQGQHSVGGADGGAGLAGTDWSREHGDLRAPHFFALHGLQALPLAAYLLEHLPLGERGRHLAFAAIALAWTALAVGTLAQAMAGRPLLRLG